MESAALTRPRPGSGIAARARESTSTRLAKVAFARAVRGLPRRLPGLPDVPELRLLLLAAVGPRGARPAGPVLRGLPRARPSTRSRSRRGALLSLLGQGGDRVWVAMTLASFLWLVWGIYRLGRVAFTPLVGAIAALLLLTALRLRVPRRARLHRRALHGAGGVGRGAGGGAARAAAGPCSLLLAAGGAAAARGMDPRRPLLPVDEPRRHLGRASALRRADRDRAADRGPPSTSPSPATRCSRCTTRARRPRTSAASARWARSRRRCRSSSPSLVKLPVLLGGAAGHRRSRCGRRRGGRSCRSCCCSAASARSC